MFQISIRQAEKRKGWCRLDGYDKGMPYIHRALQPHKTWLVDFVDGRCSLRREWGVARFAEAVLPHVPPILHRSLDAHQGWAVMVGLPGVEVRCFHWSTRFEDGHTEFPVTCGFRGAVKLVRMPLDRRKIGWRFLSYKCQWLESDPQTLNLILADRA